MHRLRGSERILLIYLLSLLQCVFISTQVRKKEGSYVAFFSFSSNISLLNGMSYGRTWHRLMSTTYCPRRSRWGYLSPAISLSSRRRRRHPDHVFCLKALFSSCLHCHSFCFGSGVLCFSRRRMRKRGVSIIIFFTLPLTPSCLG